MDLVYILSVVFFRAWHQGLVQPFWSLVPLPFVFSPWGSFLAPNSSMGNTAAEPQLLGSSSSKLCRARPCKGLLVAAHRHGPASAAPSPAAKGLSSQAALRALRVIPSFAISVLLSAPKKPLPNSGLPQKAAKSSTQARMSLFQGPAVPLLQEAVLKTQNKVWWRLRRRPEEMFPAGNISAETTAVLPGESTAGVLWDQSCPRPWWPGDEAVPIGELLQ